MGIFGKGLFHFYYYLWFKASALYNFDFNQTDGFLRLLASAMDLVLYTKIFRTYCLLINYWTSSTINLRKSLFLYNKYKHEYRPSLLLSHSSHFTFSQSSIHLPFGKCYHKHGEDLHLTNSKRLYLSFRMIKIIILSIMQFICFRVQRIAFFFTNNMKPNNSSYVRVIFARFSYHILPHIFSHNYINSFMASTPLVPAWIINTNHPSKY